MFKHHILTLKSKEYHCFFVLLSANQTTQLWHIIVKTASSGHITTRSPIQC